MKALLLTAVPLVITPVVLFSIIDPDEDAMAFGALSVLAFLFIILLMVGCSVVAAIAVFGAVRRGRNRSALGVFFGFGVGLMLGIASCNASLNAWVRVAPASTPAPTPIPTVARLPAAAPTLAPTQPPFLEPTATTSPVLTATPATTQTPTRAPTAAPSPVPTRTGKPNAPGPPPPEDALLWQFSTGKPNEMVLLSPTVVEGVVYAGARNGGVYALDAVTGELLWNAEFQNQVNPPPLAVGTAVYIEQRRGDYYALDAATGDFLQDDGPRGGRVRGAAVSDGTVHVTAVFPGGRTEVRGYDANTGDLLWESYPRAPEIGLQIFPPVVLGDQMYLSDESNVHALDVATGGLAWSVDVGAIVPAPPTARDGVVYIRSYEGVHAFDESTGESLWKSEEEFGGIERPPYIANGVLPLVGGGVLRALDAATGQLLWSFEEGHVTFIAGIADELVFVEDGRSFYALDVATGQEVWSLDNDWGFGEVTVVDGVLYANSVNGYLHTFNARTGAPIWSVRIGYYIGPDYGPYLVSDGVVYAGYLREDSGVIALVAP